MIGEIRKTRNYIKRNGLRKTWYMVDERFVEPRFNKQRRPKPYRYEAPTQEELKKQREYVWAEGFSLPKISVLVPAYETAPVFMEALLESLRQQSYPRWELVIADAGSSDVVRDTVEQYLQTHELPAGEGAAVRYERLAGNEGISGNSNQALSFATGDYIGLLDHDDLLTPDCLFTMVQALEKAYLQGEGSSVDTLPQMLYSDEDKCDTAGEIFYEPNRKPDFNPDFLRSNNYICHFLLLKRDLMQELGFRPAYDGAQDHDLILRASERLLDRAQVQIVHVDKVLYHWRCHEASTAANPESKRYAYEAGRRAVQDHLDRMGISGVVQDTPHVGFFEIVYGRAVQSEASAAQSEASAAQSAENAAQSAAFAALALRDDLLAVCGSVIGKNHRICSGAFPEAIGLKKHFSGTANAASVCRDVEAFDARTILLREQDIPLFEDVMQVPYVRELANRNGAYANCLDEQIWGQRGRVLCEKLQERYPEKRYFLWNPALQVCQ